MQLRQRLCAFIILGSSIISPLAFGQADLSEADLNAPENQIPAQGKPGDLKTDVPPESLSFGNQDEGVGTSKSPAATDIPPPQPAPAPAKKAQVNKYPPPPLTAEAPAPALEEIPPPGPSTHQTTVESDSENPVGDDAERAAEKAKADAQKSDEESADSGHTMIDPEANDEDEPAHPKNKICNCQFQTSVPYSERRTPIGGYFSVGAGNFAPVNYQPDFNPGTFANYYNKVSPSIEMTFGLKYNFFLGSLSAQLSGGYFQATSTSDGGALTLFPVTAGLNFAMDNLFKEPYVVPYVIFGMYSDVYNESVGGQTVKGNSAFSEFYAVGLLFQLDSLDEEGHNSAYQDFGLENTFLYVEARSYLPASNDVPDFSTPIQFSGGLKVEF